MAGARLQGSAGVGTYVYRHDPATDETSVVADSFNKPNGLAFSPDESVLYVTDTGANQAPGTYFVGLPHRVRAFGGALAFACAIALRK